MKKNLYTISSPLPPAELKERLTWEAAIQNRIYKHELKTSWRWKDEYKFTVYLTISQTFSGTESYWSMGPSSVSGGFFAGLSYSAWFSPLFCGEILPNGNGSIIQGYFRQLLFGWILGIFFLGAGLLSLAMGEILAAILWYFLLFKAGIFELLFYPEFTKPSAELWAVLEYLVEKAKEPPS